MVSVWPTLAQQNGRSGAARTACRPTETCRQIGYLRATAVTRGNRVVRRRAARNGARADSAVRRHPEHTGDRKSLESFPGGPITSNPGRAAGTPRTALGTPQSARWALIRWCPCEPLEPCSVAAILGKAGGKVFPNGRYGSGSIRRRAGKAWKRRSGAVIAACLQPMRHFAVCQAVCAEGVLSAGAGNPG